MVYPNPDLKLNIPKFLYEFADLARDEGFTTYLVGGVIRDLLLSQSVFDYDLIIDFNALELAQMLSKKGLLEIQSLHPAFGTARVLFKGISLDLATTRTESYAFPG
ncbi:MAG: hypothetical protein SFU25_08525, partial [Candidatus Caenarcaniphilales bacterium]|nr:hypothetical protein [Candidatus Caenarcaniphilales bacterium]